MKHEITIPIKSDRDKSVDILRGLAILTMIAANTAGFILKQPHPMALRLYGTFAAPLFITIAGAMVFKSTFGKPNRKFTYFLKRGLIVMFFGAFIDVCFWRLYPFLWMEVLYLIGLAIPLAYLGSRVNVSWRFAIMIFFFFGAFLLQKLFGYVDLPTHVQLSDPAPFSKIQAGNVWRHWLWDGYFPIFPWLGFTFLGGILSHLRWEKDKSNQSHFITRYAFKIGLSLLIVGSVVWIVWTGPLLIRDNFSEMFYPPTVGYIITACGVIFCLFSLTDKIGAKQPFILLSVYGKSSLLMYILTWFVLSFTSTGLRFLNESSIGTFFIFYVLLSLALFGIALVMIQVRKIWHPSWLVVRQLIGG